jgi:hypothetical protein
MLDLIWIYTTYYHREWRYLNSHSKSLFRLQSIDMIIERDGISRAIGDWYLDCLETLEVLVLRYHRERRHLNRWRSKSSRCHWQSVRYHRERWHLSHTIRTHGTVLHTSFLSRFVLDSKWKFKCSGSPCSWGPAMPSAVGHWKVGRLLG